MKRQSGISLIEQLITLLVTSTAVLGVVKFQANMYDAALNSKQRVEAVSLAQQQLEVLRSAGYETAAASSQDDIQGTTTKFRREWTITPDSSLSYDVTSVTVTWSTKGKDNNVNLNSRIAKTSQSDSGRFMLGELGTPTATNGVPFSQISTMPVLLSGDIAEAGESPSTATPPTGD